MKIEHSDTAILTSSKQHVQKALMEYLLLGK